MRPLTPEEFGGLFDTCATAFRLETLQAYDVPAEVEDLRAWRAGEPLPDSDWARFIAQRVAAGARWQRVHVISEPVGEYLGYEFERYRDSVVAGEDVRIAVRNQHPQLGKLKRDWWGFDLDSDQPTIALMRYDRRGRFLGAVGTDNSTIVRASRADRALALDCAVPLADYLIGVGAAR